MKKYIKPVAKVVRLESENLLAGSPEMYNRQGGGDWFSNQGTWDDSSEEDY